MKLHDANYWINRPMDSEHDWVDDEDNWITSYVASAEHPHRQLIVDAVRRFYPCNVLEVGCNVGSNLIRLKEMFVNIQVAGIDISEKCINITRDYLPKASLKVGSYFNIPFPDKSYDCVLADATLMYAGPDKINEAMAEIDRIARKVIIVVDRVSKSKEGTRSGHVWARNYPLILKSMGYKVEKTPITKELWPYSQGWQKQGMFMVATK